jgi:hypothetical protein
LAWQLIHRKIYVELNVMGDHTAVEIIAVSGSNFWITDILINGEYHAAMTFGRPGHPELWSEIRYPIKMTPPCDLTAILTVLDTGYYVHQSYWGYQAYRGYQGYLRRPRTVLVRTNEGDFSFKF